jgi:ATP-dependent RNA helicase DeaD
LVKQLRSNKFNADAIHGDLKQNARDRVMRMFREGKLQILIATDIAARGIDVKGVDAVINYDVPKNMDYYIHRIGRTARAQMTGSAYTLISSDIHGNIRDIERVTKDKLNEHKVEGYVKSEEKSDYSDRPRYEHRDRKDFSRGRDNKRFDRGERKFSRNDNDTPRPVHNKTPGTTRMFITVGTMDNVDNHSLKDFLVKDVGVSASDITDVYTKDRFSFVEVKDEITEKILNVKSVNGRNVHVSVAKERGSGGDSRGNDRGRRPQGNFRRGGGNFRGDRKPFHSGGERKSFRGGGEHKTFHGFGQNSDRPARDGQHRDYKSRKFKK